jgi:anthraniloyl-CoA monooxygenase
MRVGILGAGPSGLYLGLLLKRADPSHEVTIVERNPADATYGWGVVFSDRTLGSFRDADHRSFVRITDELVLWDAIDVRLEGEVVRCGGQTFSGISRKRLLQILHDRCREVGVELSFEEEVEDPWSRFEGAHLLVAADGANSVSRRLHEGIFRPRIFEGRSRYVWFGTTLPLDAFTFIFRRNEHGMFQVHAYPFDGSTSTFIVETDEATWRRAGLDTATEEESIAYCQELFAEDLGGHRLLSNRSLWLAFPTIRCRTWRHGSVVLIGDAAHTAHFSIGSGTKLAMEDAIALADALARRDDIDGALAEYEAERRPIVERLQHAARQSQTYFEETDRSTRLEPMQFAFHLLTRSGRMGYEDLRLRDASFVARLDGWFSSRAAGGKHATAVAPPPALVPFDLRDVRTANRVVVEASPVDTAVDADPGEDHRRALDAAAATGAGLVLTDAVAVSPEGRVNPGSTGLFTDEQAERWRAIVTEARADRDVRVGIRLSHAGRRGSCRSRDHGVDRPLQEGGWPVVSASALPHGTGMPIPRELDDDGMTAVVEAFAAAARRAATAGFDLVLLHMAQGSLLASFLSPLSNRREDPYGGSLETRLRFPLRVLEGVREAWPEERPVAASINAVDVAREGAGLDEAVEVAAALRDAGCDLIEVRAGQEVLGAMPSYDPYELVSYSDRIRNDVGAPTLAFGPIGTLDRISTIVAGGRADLCHLV